ncbi:XRE family transcriptional regulator [Providencia rettgeri]|nr:XRE family transcriptional regulator [Providencia rettgeri]
MLNAQRNENTNVTIYIGTYLKHRRKAVGLTGAQLASRLNISQQQVSRYERGKNSITIQGLLDILQALDKDWSDYYYYVIANNFSNKI